MKKNKKILLSSQDFGYGPTTQMFSFIKHLLLSGFKGDIYIINNSPSKIFFDNFTKENSGENIFITNTLIGDYDIYVGFYDPDIIFEGKKKNKKTLFLCNLTFLWNQDFIEKYDENTNIDSINFNQINNHHEKIMLAYLFADKVFIRNTDGIDKTGKLFEKIKLKTELIGPIIYPKIFNKGNLDCCIVQLGGQINPITTNSFYEIYIKLICKIINSIKGNIKIIINPNLLGIAKKIFVGNNYDLITTLGQLEYQKLLSNCKLLISPFGINTFFESSYFNTPTFILPEQHLGHIKSLIKYVGDLSELKKSSFLLYNYKKYTLDYEDEKEFIKFLEKTYLELTNSDLECNVIENTLYSNIINGLNLSKYINKDINKIINEIV